MAHPRIASVAQRLHHAGHVASDRALAVGLQLRIGRGAGAVAVAAQVEQHQAEMRRQQLCHWQAGAVVLRIAVQHDHGRSLACAVRLDGHAVPEGMALRLEGKIHPATVIFRLVMICW